MKKIKVAFVVHGLGAEGISAFTVNLMEQLDMDIFDISLIMAIDDNNIPQLREKEVECTGVKIYRTCDLGTLLRIKKHLEKLKKILLSEGPYDVFHTNMDMLNGLNLLIAKQAKIACRIAHSHTSQMSKEKNKIRNIQKLVYRTLMRSLISRYSTVRIGCSSEANKYLFGKKSSTVVLNGINTDKFNNYIATTDSKRQFNISENDYLIVNVARFHSLKNPVFMVEIIHELRKLRKDFKFVWIGDGELKNVVKSKIHEYGLENYFILAGVRNDVYEILQRADIFVMPSLYEGLSISAIEAQIAGCKCLLSDGVSKEVNLGYVQFLALERGPKIWAEEINTYLNSNTKRWIPEKAQITKYSSRHMADEISEIYINGGVKQ